MFRFRPLRWSRIPPSQLQDILISSREPLHSRRSISQKFCRVGKTCFLSFKTANSRIGVLENAPYLNLLRVPMRCYVAGCITTLHAGLARLRWCWRLAVRDDASAATADAVEGSLSSPSIGPALHPTGRGSQEIESIGTHLCSIWVGLAPPEVGFLGFTWSFDRVSLPPNGRALAP